MEKNCFIRRILNLFKESYLNRIKCNEKNYFILDERYQNSKS